jgi:hypothetical protein
VRLRIEVKGEEQFVRVGYLVKMHSNCGGGDHRCIPRAKSGVAHDSTGGAPRLADPRLS